MLEYAGRAGMHGAAEEIRRIHSEYDHQPNSPNEFVNIYCRKFTTDLKAMARFRGCGSPLRRVLWNCFKGNVVSCMRHISFCSREMDTTLPNLISATFPRKKIFTFTLIGDDRDVWCTALAGQINSACWSSCWYITYKKNRSNQPVLYSDWWHSTPPDSELRP